MLMLHIRERGRGQEEGQASQARRRRGARRERRQGCLRRDGGDGDGAGEEPARHPRRPPGDRHRSARRRRRARAEADAGAPCPAQATGAARGAKRDQA
ncbi:MAG: hypothetical protein EOP65_14420 [Sphingomonas sp.]|nr:MAG: hypothetical protein EOP65_14420 [Sphingomonas sp.]